MARAKRIITKIRALALRPGTPGERQAAEAALERIGAAKAQAKRRSRRPKRQALYKRKNLTEEGVAKLRLPIDRQYENHYDALVPGLVLRVNYGGAKVWHVLYYVKRVKNGKRVAVPTTHGLGRYPTLKVKEARDKARQFLADPRKAKAKAELGSFKEEAEKFLERYVGGHDQDQEKEKELKVSRRSKKNKEPKVPLRSRAEIKRVLNKYVYPEWQDRPFRDIQRNDVTDLIDKIVDNHGARQADVVLAIVRKMMNWLTTRHHDYVSPVVRGMARTIPKERKRERFLDNDEIRALWTACADMGTFGALVKTLLLTAQREAKVADMKWDDVVDREWRIASEPREKANAKLLRLPQMALDIIAAQPRIAGNPYVFPAGRGSGRFNSFSQRKAELDEKLTTPSTFRTKPWVYHDLRRTSRKLMTRAGVRPDVGELALGHSIKGMQGVYDDITEYQPMIDDALQRVASEIDKIINPPPDNVVALRP